MPFSDICWKNLEKEVDTAIKNKDASFIKLYIKNKEECKYMKKYAEFKLKDLDYGISMAIFLVGLGIAAVSLGYVDTGAPLIVNLVVRYFGLIGIISGEIWLGSIILRQQKYKTIKEIILNAEKKIILSESNEGAHSGIIDFLGYLARAIGSYLRE